MRLHLGTLRERFGALACAALVVVGASLLVAGCGDDDDEQVAEALGGGEEDADQLQTFFEELQEFPDRQIELVTAFRSQDVPGARAAVDQQLSMLERGDEIAAEFETAEIQTVLQDYLAALRNAVEAADAFVVYFESGDAQTDRAAGERLLADLERTQTAAEQEESRFVQRLIDNLPDEADEQLREGVQDFTERFREAQRSGNP